MGSAAEANCSLATGCAEFHSLPQAVTDENGSQTMGLKTVNSKLYFTHPLKLLVTQSRGFPSSANCQWLYNCYNSGGALNGNECVALDIGVGENCNVVLTTQEYPKISASSVSDLVATKKITGRVDEKGLLAVLPDPILCYKNASYHQKQVYKLSPGGNLILLDWVIAGRIALGEIWDMKSFVSESEVYVDGHLVSGDAIILGDQGKHPLKERLQHTKVLGSCAFVGPYFSDLKRTIEKKVHEISGGESDGVTASVSVLTQTFCDGVIVKLQAAQSTEQARKFFRRLIEDTILWIGGDPLDR